MKEKYQKEKVCPKCGGRVKFQPTLPNPKAGYRYKCLMYLCGWRGTLVYDKEAGKWEETE